MFTNSLPHSDEAYPDSAELHAPGDGASLQTGELAADASLAGYDASPDDLAGGAESAAISAATYALPDVLSITDQGVAVPDLLADDGLLDVAVVVPSSTTVALQQPLDTDPTARRIPVTESVTTPAVMGGIALAQATRQADPEIIDTATTSVVARHPGAGPAGAAADGPGKGETELGKEAAGGNQHGDGQPPDGGGTLPVEGDDGDERPHTYTLPLNFGPKAEIPDDMPAEYREAVYSGSDSRTGVDVRVADRRMVGWDSTSDEPVHGRRVTTSIQLNDTNGRMVSGRQTTEDLPYDSSSAEVARRANPEQTPSEQLAREVAEEQLRDMTAELRARAETTPRSAFTEITQLSPRPDAREATLAALRSKLVLGVEVTDPVLAQACAAGNIDPQHLGLRPDLSAIESITALLSGEAGAATISPDLDSIGSMAVLAIAIDIIAQNGALEGVVLDRIQQIGSADRFEKGEWLGVRPLPTLANPWSDIGTAAEMQQLAAMASVVRDYKLPLDERVALLKDWLATGREPQAYRDRAEAERRSLIQSLETQETTVTTAAGGRVAAVTSPYLAMGLGYHLAPIVVALNPAFRFRGGEPHAKMTIAQFTDQYVDLQAAFAELNELEAAARDIPVASLTNRWAGSPAIGGSPQGESTLLSIEQVADVLARHPR